MESNIKSSFIPKDTVQQGRRGGIRSYTRGVYDLFVLAATVLFIASIALAIGVFLYVQYIEASEASKIEQLQRAQDAFEPALIEELTRIDDRMVAAEDILYTHIAPSQLFRILEELTLETVSFDNFDLQSLEGNTITISMEGVARSVNSIALQADLFGRHSAITSPIFENITRDDGVVHFDVSANVNPNALRYVNVVRGASSQSSLQQGQQTENQNAPEEPAEESSIPLFAP